MHETLIAAQGPCGGAECKLMMHLSIRITEVVLLSGFGPWPEAPENPSWQAVEPLQDTLIGGYDVRVVQLPVVWDESMPLFWEQYERLHPVIAIGAGVAMGESRARLEVKAVNTAAGADNNNDTWPTTEIEPGGPDSYKPLLPINLLQRSLTDAGYLVSISNNAGTYLCNFMFYNLMKRLMAEKPELHILGGFVHVPRPDAITPAQMTEAFKLMIGTLADYRASLTWDHPMPDDGPVLPTVESPPAY
jgi:pyroglutamyl-peptidase